MKKAISEEWYAELLVANIDLKVICYRDPRAIRLYIYLFQEITFMKQQLNNVLSKSSLTVSSIIIGNVL